MDDPYAALGVPKTASQAEIQSAYRTLAKRHHPDLNPGKPAAEARFKEISAANALLSNAEKRARFDRGEIDSAGAERPPERRFYRDFGDDAARTKYRPEGGFDASAFDDFFSRAFETRAAQAARGADLHFALTITFLEAANGASRVLTLPDGRKLKVEIAAGIADGQTLRLKGQGVPGLGQTPDGDALIAISIAAHPIFRREGDAAFFDLKVTLKEAVLGAKIDVATPKGNVTLTVPPNSTSGTRLRIKGRGIAGGDLFAVLELVLPPTPEPALAAFLAGWKPDAAFDPRATEAKP
ncbi:MAG: DnaJ domain-containing protein [Telmatospirillum sp.]|nr:DnaJ domain-containing protein [Telmatospirillum sp.]